MGNRKVLPQSVRAWMDTKSAMHEHIAALRKGGCGYAYQKFRFVRRGLLHLLRRRGHQNQSAKGRAGEGIA
jgi:hypothetical protein